MDLVRTGPRELSGLNGVFEHIIAGVLADPRWFLRWGGWNADATKRTLDLTYVDAGKPAGSITIIMEEVFYCQDPDCVDRLHTNNDKACVDWTGAQ
jgi:hypothetical protein